MLDKQYKRFFDTLASKTRLEIIHVLKDGPHTVSDVEERLDCQQSTISHNLKRLEKCQFVTVERRGKHRIYSLNKKTIEPLMKLIEKHANTYCKGLCDK